MPKNILTHTRVKTATGTDIVGLGVSGARDLRGPFMCCTRFRKNEDWSPKRRIMSKKTIRDRKRKRVQGYRHSLMRKSTWLWQLVLSVDNVNASVSGRESLNGAAEPGRDLLEINVFDDTKSMRAKNRCDVS
jgi:hypothetical protein